MKNYLLCAALTIVSSAHGRAFANPPQATPPAPAKPLSTVNAALPQVVIADDNTKITKSCRLIIAPRPLVDLDNNGVIQIEGDDITVDLSGQTLIGASPLATRDTLQGIGIRIRGKRVTIRNGSITGFRVGIFAAQCDQSVFERLDFGGNFSQRLLSTPEDENAADWLTPHNNDQDEWMTRYGAAIAVRDANNVVIREIQVRQGQNGILLSRVSNSQIYNCDASFLSGWGIALWRSCSNTVCHNAFDFCIRGYSHKVYNRGQDSAGILCFEQSSDNTIIMNSATHCGDGFFGFAGREALGEVAPSVATPRANDWYSSKGCNRNLIALNDFSDAAAHGVETTFSFDNHILYNRFDRDAICGIWGGYSQRLDIRGNVFTANGDSPSGTENGGINIEHGKSSMIADNIFTRNSAGIRLWWDEDSHLASLPWTKTNGAISCDNTVVRNTFTDDVIGIFLRSSTNTIIADNTMTRVVVPIDNDAQSVPVQSGVQSLPAGAMAPADWVALMAIVNKLPGNGSTVDIVDKVAITKRKALAGRAAIAIGEFDPYDFVLPMVIREPSPTNLHRWKLLGPERIKFVQAGKTEGDVRTGVEPGETVASVETEHLGQLSNYELTVFWGRQPGQSQQVRGTLLSANWRVLLFPLPTPVTAGSAPSQLAFEEAAKNVAPVYVESLTFDFGMNGPDAVKLVPPSPTVPKDNFGLIATTTFQAPVGNWIVRTKSDDGIRVFLDGKIIIDRWNKHATNIDEAHIAISTAHEASMTVQYFELDGDARLDLKILQDSANSTPPILAP